MKPAITVLGTGRMGAALVHALLKAGHRTTVWNRTLEKTVPLAAAGAAVATSVREAVQASEVIIVNVTDYPATAVLLRGDVAQALRGKLVVELTSGTPQGARETGGWAEDHGVTYLDGAILATPDFIGTEHGTLLVSGPQQAFERSKDMLLALGGNVQHVGDDLGLANALDSALLALMWGSLFGALQSIAVCRAENIDLGELARQWTATAPVVEGLVADLIKRTKAGRLAADNETLSSISPHYSAFRHLVELMEVREIDRTVVDGYDAIFRRGIAAGHLHDDFAALSQFMGKAG
ncbi:MAG TPA: NAD(P)-binding domain-containing protein [Mesorhizobium sp.]|jgi:3-hydroxyisobutyrate dehydrogenase-like beta-hydroxyacid dehydrogenase|uniref:NAD(P)-dependent oxidoreductase n=1 Tax=Mesorhizobium sp. TaxID=1871066 RepID=UPI002DDCC2D2|nr:NAD(P)-binding domain-containing protein [Mesorhizobium sp.]HEV2504279.1 NAD(P)-binding domain-containing protein [Mesorhizobium sp.]